jgi:GNAT superfamily N-acetyltransferase
MEPTLTLADAFDAATKEAVDDVLSRYNLEQIGYRDGRALAVLVADPKDGEILGGLFGHTSLGLFFIDLVALPKSLRGQGIGRRVLRTAEEEAVRRGCKSAVLYTISFQAPGFYARLGYREFGRVECDPPGTARVFMSKSLVPTH